MDMNKTEPTGSCDFCGQQVLLVEDLRAPTGQEIGKYFVISDSSRIANGLCGWCKKSCVVAATSLYELSTLKPSTWDKEKYGIALTTSNGFRVVVEECRPSLFTECFGVGYTVTAPDLRFTVLLDATNVEDAKAEAVRVVEEKLKKHIERYQKAATDLKRVSKK